MSGTVGAVDASIPLQAGKGVTAPNPLQQIGQFAGIQNALNQAQAFPGQMELQRQAIQRGGIDVAKLANQAAYQVGLPVLANPNFTLQDLTSAWGSAEHNLGIPTHGPLADVVGISAAPNTPEWRNQVRAILTSRSQGDAGAALGTVTRAPATMQNGQFIIPGGIAGQGMAEPNAFAPAGPAVKLGISPGQGAERVVVGKNPDGSLIYGPLTRVTPPSLGGTAGQGPLGTGRLPDALRNPQRSQGAPPSGAASNDADGLVSAPPTGTTDAVGAQVAPAQAVADRVARFQTEMFPLTQAQSALAKAPTGRGSDAVHAASSYLNTFAPPILQRALGFISPIMTPEETAAYDEAKKYLTQGQLGAPGATRSNEGLSTAGAANPSTTITKEAAQLVLKGMIGLRRMEQDEGQAWIAAQQAGAKPADFNKFRGDFQKSVDPQVYLFDQMTPAQRQKAVKSAKNPAEFMAAVDRAERNGILSPPGATNGGQ